MLEVGDKAPSFSLMATTGKSTSLRSLLAANPYLLLYFYPKSLTSGCTKQSVTLQENLKALAKAGLSVAGISPDAPELQLKFAEKYGLTFPLLADPLKEVCSAYGVWKKKSMYGKTYMGVERTSYILQKSGKIAAVFAKVKVPEHMGLISTFLAEA